MIAVTPSHPPSTLHSTPRRRAERTRYFPVATLMLALASAAILLGFPPDQYAFYPRCPFFTYFHVLCPGCGSTRALAALLRGHLLQALHLNPLTTLLLPVALLYHARHLIQRNPASRCPQPSAYAVYSLLAVTVLFGILRNIPI